MFHVVMATGFWLLFLATPVGTKGPRGVMTSFMDSRTSWQAQVTSDQQAWGLWENLEKFSPSCKRSGSETSGG